MISSKHSSRRALVVSYSAIASDPRVHRQISWLVADGWEVDSLGLSCGPVADVAKSYHLKPPKGWTTTKWGTVITQSLMPHTLAFRMLLVSRIPDDVRRRIQAGDYQAVIFNESEFGPWLTTTSDFKRSPVIMHMHNDLHEYHNPIRRRNTLGGRITSRYYRWVRNHTGKSIYDTRSVVNAPIGELYREEFNIDALLPITNIPRYWDLDVHPVDPNNIKLLFHGMPSLARGFEPILEAMVALPDTFEMTFMIMPNPFMESWLHNRIKNHPAKDRIHIVPPAPMTEIPRYINEYDVEVIYYPGSEPNLLYATPNKFFEAIQGRLAIVTGESAKALNPIIDKWGNGVIAPGYSGPQLASALSSLTAAKITKMKQASAKAAATLNAENEGQRFVALFED